MFSGFRSLSANFTPTPNQFFDEVVGYYPYCVVSVVGILIRSTLGWDDPDTGERRIEAELPLSAFLRPEISESSARRGLTEGMAAGLLVRTASANSREGARYALRWTDEAAQARAIERSRRSIDDPLLSQPERDLSRKIAAEAAQKAKAEMGEEAMEAEEGRGVNLTPLDLAGRGVKLTPLRGVKLTPPNKKENKEKKNKTLNVEEEINHAGLEEPSGLFAEPSQPSASSSSSRQSQPKAADPSPVSGVNAPRRSTAAPGGNGAGQGNGASVLPISTPETSGTPSAAVPKLRRSALSEQLDSSAEALAAELNDRESLRRHRQLLEICERHGLSSLPALALRAVRKRQEGKGEPLDKPGAYYQRILIGLLEEHQVFVPKSGEDDADEVRRQARESLGMEE